MTEPMTKERLLEIELRGNADDMQMIRQTHELIAEVRRCHDEIERLEKALAGSESLRHTIMTSALDAKRGFTKRIAELEEINANIGTAYRQLQEHIATYFKDRK